MRDFFGDAEAAALLLDDDDDVEDGYRLTVAYSLVSIAQELRLLRQYLTRGVDG